MTASDKHTYLTRFHRFQKSREQYFAPKIYAALRSQYNQVLHHIHSGYTEHQLIGQIHSGSIVSVLRPLYLDAATVYGAKVRADLQRHKRSLKVSKSTPLETKRFSMGFSEQMQSLIEQYFSLDILNQSEGITQTTRELIRQVFTNAYAKGEGINDIIKQLENTELSRVRARLIARTETVTAANQGALFVAKDTGLDLNKEWLSASDNRVRRDHRNVSGQVVTMDGFFNVGGYEMSVPGDRGGKDGKPLTPAAEVINCRCTTLFIPVD